MNKHFLAFSLFCIASNTLAMEENKDQNSKKEEQKNPQNNKPDSNNPKEILRRFSHPSFLHSNSNHTLPVLKANFETLKKQSGQINQYNNKLTRLDLMDVTQEAADTAGHIENERNNNIASACWSTTATGFFGFLTWFSYEGIKFSLEKKSEALFVYLPTAIFSGIFTMCSAQDLFNSSRTAWHMNKFLPEYKKNIQDPINNLKPLDSLD